MNERILELANEVGISVEYLTNTKQLVLIEKFAELIVADCIKAVENTKTGYPDYRSQIEEAMRSWCVRSIKEKFGVNNEI